MSGDRSASPVAALEALSSWLAGFAAAGPLPAAVRGRAVEILLDDLAAAVGAAAEPAVRQVAELAGRRGPGGARVWAGGFAEPGWAALANAVACSWIELDEGYRLATCHGGLYALPAVTGRADAAAFATDQLADPAVASVRRRVSARPYEPEPQPPLDRPARVTITLRDGSSHHAESASSLGSPDRPVSPEAALAKLDTLTAACPGFAAMARALLAGQVDDAAPWRHVGAELLGCGS